jgi:hypothetical protein
MTTLLLLAFSAPAQPPVEVPHGSGVPADTLELTEEQRRELERLATLGYITGSERAPAAEGVTVLEPDAYEGYTIYVSRDFSGAFVVDMSGTIVHTWHDGLTQEWTRAWAYPDGSVLRVSSGPARLVKLDRDSRVVWTYGDDRFKAHHDFQVQPDGTVYVLMRQLRRFPWLSDRVIQDDMVCALEPDGDAVSEIGCVSLPEAFHASEYRDMLHADWFLPGADPFHTNSVEVLDGSVEHAAFRAGNVLVSIRNMDCLAVLDPESGSIVWTDRGLWQRQHEARITPDGRIMLFDNRKFDGESRVVEYDVASREIVWSYAAPGFFSRGAGAQQLLPNGNILVTESTRGRLFEITRDGRVVWEYLNPRRIRDGKTIVRIPRAYRVPYDYFTGEFGKELSTRR